MQYNQQNRTPRNNQSQGRNRQQRPSRPTNTRNNDLEDEGNSNGNLKKIIVGIISLYRM